MHRILGDERGCLSCNTSAPRESKGEHQAALQENTRKILVYIILKAIDTGRPTYCTFNICFVVIVINAQSLNSQSYVQKYAV